MGYNSAKHVNEGYNAFHNGTFKKDNPYVKGGNAHEDWLFGWKEAYDVAMTIEEEKEKQPDSVEPITVNDRTFNLHKFTL
jgi:ribosome modulation factor